MSDPDGDFNAWIGRAEHRQDRIDPGHFARWCAALDRTAPADGTVPQGFHWCLCLPDAPTAQLGPDGHPRRAEDAPSADTSSFLPPLPDLPRRMWAASTVDFIQPLRQGEAVTRTSRVQAITPKSGGSGAMVFVEIGHETSGEAGLAVRELQTVVYRGAADPGAPPAPPPLGAGLFDPAAWQAHRALRPAPPLLFRYSALTYNSHRIHYDAPYATEVENYRGLVVHGPLTASLLLDLAARKLGENGLKSFRFRGVSPAISDELLHLVLRTEGAAIELAGFAGDGRAVMQAAAVI